MKRYFATICLMIFLVAFSACSKKATPVKLADPTTTVDSTKRHDSVSHVTLVQQHISYPSTESYRGLLVNSFYNTKDSDNYFQFDVVRTSVDSIVIMSHGGVSSLYRNTDNEPDIIKMNAGINTRGPYSGNGSTFEITNDSLYVTWLFAIEMPGTCDYEMSIGHFAGRTTVTRR